MGLTDTGIRINGRPVRLANFNASSPTEETQPKMRAEFFPADTQPKMRAKFPAADTHYMGGESDGTIYRSVFGGVGLSDSYQMICAFLREEGYGDIPLPKNIKELEHFRLNTRNRQVLLFEDNGYVHNPIKVLFPLDRRKKSTLELLIYNEKAEDHLLRFHNKL